MSEGFITRRGGGSELSFDVVGGTTQPTGKANRIWVNTSVTITSWIFHPTQPTAIEGRVWFQISLSGAASFNALKKNTLNVWPAACRQCVNGAWVNKTAKIYQSGAWKDWRLNLFSSGNQYSELTGGWIDVAGSAFAANSSALSLSAAGTAVELQYGGNIHTAGTISMAGQSTLKIDVASLTNTTPNKFRFGITSTVPSDWNPAYVAYGEINGTGKSSLDISSLNGSYYVAVSVGFIGDYGRQAAISASEVYAE